MFPLAVQIAYAFAPCPSPDTQTVGPISYGSPGAGVKSSPGDSRVTVRVPSTQVSITPVEVFPFPAYSTWMVAPSSAPFTKLLIAESDVSVKLIGLAPVAIVFVVAPPLCFTKPTPPLVTTYASSDPVFARC